MSQITLPKVCENLSADKAVLRQQMLAVRNKLSATFIDGCADAFRQGMCNMRSYQMAKTVMIYMSFQNEVPTRHLIQQAWQDHKNVVLPYTDDTLEIWPYYVESFDQLRLSAMGIPEPDPDRCVRVDPLDIDLLLIPGIAFDLQGGRIGFGKACYDRFLPDLRWNAEKVALAYQCQILEHLPSDPHDVLMDVILTEDGLKQCHPSSCPDRA